MRLPPIGHRLKAIVPFVRESTRIADIGTDHAYLPAYLLLTGRIRHAIAADIAVGPLQKAAATVAAYGLSADQIELRQSDGLSAICPDETDDIILAGMGGDLIVDILAAAPWLRDSQKRMVLQPMTRAPVVRRFLYTAGFAIREERAVREGGRLYTVLLAQYDGIEKNQPDTYFYTGELPTSPDEAACAYVRRELRLLRDRLGGLQSAASPDEDLQKETAKLCRIMEELQAVLHKMEETI